MEIEDKTIKLESSRNVLENVCGREKATVANRKVPFEILEKEMNELNRKEMYGKINRYRMNEIVYEEIVNSA